MMQVSKSIRGKICWMMWLKLFGLVLVLVFVSSGCAQEPTLTVLTGDTSCAWGATDCNRCVSNVPEALDRLQNDYQSAGRIRFDGYAWPTADHLLHRIDGSYEHIQSIGRIAGLGNNEYMVITHSTSSDESKKEGALAVVRMGARQNTGGNPFLGMPNGDGPDQNASNRTVARTFSGNNHPGGLSVLGHYVFVAQWCQPHGNDDWCQMFSPDVHGDGFSVYDVSNVNQNTLLNSNPPIHRRYHHAYSEQWMTGEDGDKYSTASIAAVKLSDGQYLIALGRSGGEEYGFYLAKKPTARFYFQNESNFDTSGEHEKIQPGENAGIVTDCQSGELYMFQIGAYTIFDDEDKVHLYKLVLNDGDIDFQYIKSRTFFCRGSEKDGAGDWCHFDAGAGIYVTPEGGLILYATDWHQSAEGNIRLVEFR